MMASSCVLQGIPASLEAGGPGAGVFGVGGVWGYGGVGVVEEYDGQNLDFKELGWG